MRFIALALTSLVLSAQAARAQTFDPVRAEAVADSLARAHVAAGIIPSITLAVARHGKTAFARSYGTADIEMGVPATTATVYRLRSISKQYAAAFVMRLVDAGKLSLDDALSRHLPDFPTHGRHITLRNLLNHTSGITTKSSRLSRALAVGEEGGTGQWHKLDLSYAELVAMFGQLPLEFEPGTKYDYNNLGYNLLGHVIEKVTGVPFAVHAERELRSLGLDHTWYCDDHRIIPNRAEGYDYSDGKVVNQPYVSPFIGGAAGALCATVGDAMRWAHLLHSDSVVARASLDKMMTRPALADGDSSWYGFGSYLPPERVSLGRRKVYHGGTRPGFGTYLSHYPESGLTVAVLTNSGNGRPVAEAMEHEIARAALGLYPHARPLSAGDIEKYEGSYTVQLGNRPLEVRVFIEAGQLKSQFAAETASALLYQGDHVFVTQSDFDVHLTFAVTDGRAEALTLFRNGRDWPGTRER